MKKRELGRPNYIYALLFVTNFLHFLMSLIVETLSCVLLMKEFSSNWTCSAQFSSVIRSCLTLCDPMNRSMPGLPVYHQCWSLLKLMSMMPSNHLILFHPLILLPSILPQITVFSTDSVLRIRWPKELEFIQD